MLQNKGAIIALDILLTKLVWVGVHIQQSKGLAKSDKANDVQSQKLELVGEVKGVVSPLVGIGANEMDDLGDALVDIALELEVLSAGVLE